MHYKVNLSLTQPHKTNLIKWGLHPLIYNERSLSLVDVGSPTSCVDIKLFLKIFFKYKI